MKTKDFIKEVRELGFIVEECAENSALIENSKSETVAYVVIDRLYEFDTAYYGFEEIPEPIKKKLFNLLVDYASTPLEDRKEQERFFLKFKIETDDDCKYLNYYKEEDELTLDNSLETSSFQTLFTDKELEELKEKFEVTLSDFEKIPFKKDGEF